MTLEGWQCGLGELLQRGASRKRRNANVESSLDRLDLTADERRSLLSLSDAPGFALTCHITRWWRELRIRTGARLTCVQLSSSNRDHVLDYIDSNPFRSFFFFVEAVSFLDYVLAQAGVHATVRAVARFEKTLLLAHDARESNGVSEAPVAHCLAEDVQLVRNADASLVALDRPAEILLAMLLKGQPATPKERRGAYPVLVSPRLAHLWRPASRAEARLFRQTRAPVLFARALRQSRSTREAANSLIADGILKRARQPDPVHH